MAKGESKLLRRRMANAYLSSVISLSLVLLLVGVAALLLVNTTNVSDYFKENMKISVIMKPEVSEDEAEACLDRLDKMGYINEAQLISREQGRAEMVDMLGSDFLDVFETSPIPVSIDVTLKADYVSPDSLKVIKSKISSDERVDEVVYQQSLVEALNANLKKISFVFGVFITLLLFISFVLMNNMIRLSVYSKRFTIHTMQLVGATKSFIRGPFLVKSAFLGLFSAAISILMLVGLLYIVRSEYNRLFELFTPELLLAVIGIVFASGLIICIVSTYFVVGRLVGLSKDELYS